MNQEETEEKRQYDLIYESVSKKLEQQISSLSSLDTKASILLATVGVLFAGYLQLLTSGWFLFNHFTVLIVIEIIAFTLTGFFIFKAFILDSNEVWRDDPRPKLLLEVFSKNFRKGEYWLKSEIIKNISDSYEHNDELIIKKYNSLLVARWILFIGVCVLVVHITFSMFDVLRLVKNFLSYIICLI